MADRASAAISQNRDRLQRSAALSNSVYENKQSRRWVKYISSEMIPTISFTLHELLIRQRKEQTIASQYLITDQGSFLDEGKICLHYYCEEPASSFGPSFITLTANDKWENLLYYTSSEIWMGFGVPGQLFPSRFLPYCHALLSFPVSSWEEGKPVVGETLHQKPKIWNTHSPSRGQGWLFKDLFDCGSQKWGCLFIKSMFSYLWQHDSVIT